jgi:cysteine-rich repeat protein
MLAVIILCACHHAAPGTVDGGGGGGDASGSDAAVACTNPLTDCPAAPACQAAACGADQTCTTQSDPAQDGASCGSGMVCQSGACVAVSATCGDGVVQAGEQCDFGSGNGPGTGCEASCTFSCTMTPDSCDDGEPCDGTESCNAVTVNGATGQACAAGTPLADGASCGSGQICVAQACVAARCGDGLVTAPEQCDDGAANGTPADGCTAGCTYACSNAATDCGAPPACQMYTCTASHTCQAAADPAQDGMSCGAGKMCSAGACVPVAAGCGNGIRDAGEQCDDGNTTNLDGCDASCKFEQVQRVDDLGMSYATSSYCAKNALGTAIVGTDAQGELDTAIQAGLADGSITVQFLAVGLDDLTGTNDSAVGLGLLGGSPQTGSTTYNGWTGAMGSAGYTSTPDLDWWFTTDATTIDPTTRTPNVVLNGSIASNVVNVGPGAMSFNVNFAGVPVTMDMVDATIRATTGASSTPLTSSGTTPGHLSSEHLDPALQSFATMTSGQLCGRTLASSLANTTLPTQLVGCGGATKCKQCYTTDNTVLDLMVSGCTAGFGFVPEVKATQPDTSRSGTDAYTFTVDSTTHKVNGCKKNGAADTLADCYANAAYSTLYNLSTDRVISK